MISGLHSCKPGNEPSVGQVKTFTVEQRTGKSGKPYTKIKSAPVDQGGQPYAITKAERTDFVDSYGNVSFNLEIEPQDTKSSAPEPAQQPFPPRVADDRSSRIERQHSQEMALRYATLKGMSTLTTEDLRSLTDWFQRDVGRVPLSKVEQQAKTEFNATEAETEDEVF